MTTEDQTSKLKTNAIAVIVPCYRENAHILSVLSTIGSEVTRIYVIDDACPERTADTVEQHSRDTRVKIIRHEKNRGVGGATISGFRQALDDECKIIVKLDGDGQMDGTLIPNLISPIFEGYADYTKGNRFHAVHSISEMPWSRIFGNLALSLASKLSSGYWEVLDPTNGFIAIHSKALEKLPLESISKRYFFESDMLFHLGIIRAVVQDVPMIARYGTEESGIRVLKIIPEFLFKHTVNAFKRLLVRYIIHDTNQATIHLILGFFLVLFGIVFGAINWINAHTSGVPATAGTVALAALPVILGSQALIAFLNFDTKNQPTEPLQTSLSPHNGESFIE